MSLGLTFSLAHILSRDFCREEGSCHPGPALQQSCHRSPPGALCRPPVVWWMDRLIIPSVGNYVESSKFYRWEYKSVEPVWKEVWQQSEELKTLLPHDSGIPLPSLVLQRSVGASLVQESSYKVISKVKKYKTTRK